MLPGGLVRLLIYTSGALGALGAASGTARLVRTAEEFPGTAPWRLNETTVDLTPTAAGDDVVLLEVDMTTRFQEIKGFGGAFTDAVAHVFGGLGEALQEEVLEALWGPTGQQYNLARLPIGSTDFSTGVYNYNEPDGLPLGAPDFNQSTFSIAHDEKQILPLIKRAQARAAATAAARSEPALADGGPAGLRFLCTAWSPPGWMKAKYLGATGHMRNSAKPGMLPGDDYAASYALYLSKFLTAYKAAGVNVTMMTVQNEPDSADHMFPVAYPANNFDGPGEGAFLKEHLGPLVRSQHPDVKIYIHDGQKFHDVPIADRVDAIVAAAGGADMPFIDGVAFHWYGNNLDNYQYLAQLHARYPTLALLATEATLKDPRTQVATTTPWKEAQKYGVDIIGDLNEGTEGWIEWNVLLDQSGGPTCIGATGGTGCTPAVGHCDAPILANVDKQTLEYRDSYFIMGHFSRYIPRGSVRVACSNTTATNLLFTCAITPQNQLVVVALNTDNGGRTEPTARYQIGLGGGHYVSVATLPGHGVHTTLVDLDSLGRERMSSADESGE
jgi:glucosylceramidase